MAIADTNNIKKGEKIIKEIKETVFNWSIYADEVEISPELNDSITKTLVALNF